MKKIDVSVYTVKSGKFESGFLGFTFAVLSDLHSNSYKIDLHMLNRQIRAAKPDAVLIAGDMVNGLMKDSPEDVLNYLAVLAGHYPVFYALGNHEYRMKIYADTYGDRYYTIREYLSDKGVAFLEDETVTLEKDGQSLMLSGVEIDACFYKKIDAPTMGGGLMDKHLGTADTKLFNLLLAHNPIYFDRYAKWGADLVVSGHVHGGVVRVPGLGGMISTTLSLLPKYNSGVYRCGQSRMIVSRGLGAHTIPVRINNNPELVILKVLANN